MRTRSIATVLAATLAAAVSISAAQTSAPAGKSDAAEKHRQEDIAKHRRMAQAHEEAAKCLAAGEKETVCHERMRAACQGIAIGKYCGMRHSH